MGCPLTLSPLQGLSSPTDRRKRKKSGSSPAPLCAGAILAPGSLCCPGASTVAPSSFVLRSRGHGWPRVILTAETVSNDRGLVPCGMHSRTPRYPTSIPSSRLGAPDKPLIKKKVPRTLSPLQGLMTPTNRAVRRPKIEEFRPVTNLVTEKW